MTDLELSHKNLQNIRHYLFFDNYFVCYTNLGVDSRISSNTHIEGRSPLGSLEGRSEGVECDKNVVKARINKSDTQPVQLEKNQSDKKKSGCRIQPIDIEWGFAQPHSWVKPHEGWFRIQMAVDSFDVGVRPFLDNLPTDDC